MAEVTWFDPLKEGGGLKEGEPDSSVMISALVRMGAEVAGPDQVPARQADLRALAKESGILENDTDYNALLREVAIGAVRLQLQQRADDQSDCLQMIEALDDLFEAANLLEERLYEWSLIRTSERRRGDELIKETERLPGIGTLAHALAGLKDAQKVLEAEIKSSMSKLAPNLSSIAGPILGARLILGAGSLKRLSELPASTIQVMGAEKALFKHLHGRAPSPKHGIIYRHPLVALAPSISKGKVSRALAGKLAIAARIDYSSGTLEPEIMQSLNRRVLQIKTAAKGKSSRKKDRKAQLRRR
jgi:nucleolar protein 56